MKIELLTPVHIGTGNEIPDFEYQLKDRHLLRISLPSLLSANAAARTSLKEFATRDGIMHYLKINSSLWGKHFLYQLNGEGREFDRDRNNPKRKDDISVRECIKASFGNIPLLPGSSIKGAMLTGWLFGAGWEEISAKEQTKLLDATASDFSVILEEKLFNQMTHNNPEWGLKNTDEIPNLLSDRFWVGDIELDGDFDIRHVQRPIKNRVISLWIECVAAGATEATAGLARFREPHREALDRKHTIEELCHRCNTFTRCILVAEQQFADYCVNKRYIPARPPQYSENGILINRLAQAKQTQNSCLLRLGWASHKNATSLTLLNSSSNLSTQPPGRTNPRRRPKSRWSLKDGTPLGWCLITFEDGDYEEDR
jgi:RAMP superfamily protein